MYKNSYTILLFSFLLLVGCSQNIVKYSETPINVVNTYYNSISNEDYETTLSLYPSSFQQITKPSDLRQDFQEVKDIKIKKIIGSQIDNTLAHVLVSIEVTTMEDLQIYHIAQHDMKRTKGVWKFTTLDLLNKDEKTTLISLWETQKENIKKNATLQKHIEWVIAQQQTGLHEPRVVE
ncbi:hypothetical protein [Bacillus suaedaesalsae]|uniref:SnoaL-like domain-containing protein n=1 Tax=Bacillus suaedaesalsae TaxID=2810349 RepID=A0ABS2DLS8_9BACI|nr:hypothetical protein [Bacillus suaedaesalsae]MBM6619447.1 hypothetical protein [Bacillus suaedaesalsae]